jgi:hypothetical protein
VTATREEGDQVDVVASKGGLCFFHFLHSPQIHRHIAMVFPSISIVRYVLAKIWSAVGERTLIAKYRNAGETALEQKDYLGRVAFNEES